MSAEPWQKADIPGLERALMITKPEVSLLINLSAISRSPAYHWQFEVKMDVQRYTQDLSGYPLR